MNCWATNQHFPACFLHQCLAFLGFFAHLWCGAALYWDSLPFSPCRAAPVAFGEGLCQPEPVWYSQTALQRCCCCCCKVREGKD